MTETAKTTSPTNTTGTAAPPSGATGRDGEVRSHRVPRLRWWIIAGIVAAFAVSFQQITQPDYNTKHRATADEWLWFVVPAVAMLGYGAWRVWRSRIEAGPSGLRIVRAVDTEEIPWARLARVELRPTPNRAGTVISARLVDQRVVRIGTVPGRKPKHRARAEAFAAALEADRAHFAGSVYVLGMADEAVLDEAVCPTCKVAVEMTEQGGPFGSDIYTCPTCSTRYKYQTPPPADWTPPKTG